MSADWQSCDGAPAPGGRFSTKLLSWRSEYLHLVRVLDDLDAVLHVGGDGVAIAGREFDFQVARAHSCAAEEDVSNLFVRVRMKWNHVSDAVVHFRHHALRARRHEVEGDTKRVSLLHFPRACYVEHGFRGIGWCKDTGEPPARPADFRQTCALFAQTVRSAFAVAPDSDRNDVEISR
jgi:hypothetical protein